MNKNVSLAIKKAVGSLGRINQNGLEQKGSHKPDLFSLTGETELFQNDKGITIKIDRARDENLTDFGRATLLDRYLGQNEFSKIYLLEWQVHMPTTTCMLKDYIII